MENASKPGVVTTESGLQYIVVSKSNDRGKRPNMADVVEVHYKGSFDDGSEFDSTYRRGETADLALEEVIPGWKEALQLMREGDSFRIFLHPSLGYGEEGSPYGQVGSNQLLIFDIELITIR